MRFLLALGTVFWLLCAVPGALMAMMTPMLFDAPGSEHNTLLAAAAMALVSFPMAAVLAPALSWVSWASGRPRTAGVAMLLPMLPPSVFVAAIEFASIAPAPLSHGLGTG